MIPLLGDDPNAPFPPVWRGRLLPDGLLACGGDLHPTRLINAYRQGIFPWYSEGQPILWWWPQPRTVIFPADVHVSRRLLRTLRQQRFRVTADTDFAGVISGCAQQRRGQQGTWITSDMERAYGRLHRMGVAHSVEVWREDELAGGLYGIGLGRIFFGESMFSRRSNASKIALATLCRQLHRHSFALLDCQTPSRHLTRMGATRLPGQDFARLLEDNVELPDPIADWTRVFREEIEWDVR